jgi:hypothetical protein
MIYKEVLTSIDEEDFHDAADRVLALADYLDELSREERMLARKSMKGLTCVTDHVYSPPAIDIMPQDIAALHVGAIKFELTLKEYFDGMLATPEPDPELVVTNRWLQQLQPAYVIKIAKRHLQVEKELTDRPYNSTTPDVSYETDGMFVEYPAFADFAEYYEEAMEASGVAETKASQVKDGILLGCVVVREAVELVEFKENHVSVF